MKDQGKKMIKEYILFDEMDNVVTAINHLKRGRSVSLQIYENIQEIRVQEEIPFGHKFAICEIKRGENILKYGESIGIASQDIAPGEHVHVHNLYSIRGKVKSEC